MNTHTAAPCYFQLQTSPSVHGVFYFNAGINVYCSKTTQKPIFLHSQHGTQSNHIKKQFGFLLNNQNWRTIYFILLDIMVIMRLFGSTSPIDNSIQHIYHAELPIVIFHFTIPLAPRHQHRIRIGYHNVTCWHINKIIMHRSK